MPGDFVAKPQRQALVEQQFHAAGAETGFNSRAISSTPSACSRVTDGYCRRNSSSESPCDRYSKRMRTGTRVPVKHGEPPIISGSMLMGVMTPPLYPAL